MRFGTSYFPLLIISLLLSACESKCSVGDATADRDGDLQPMEKNGTLLYNGIRLEANEVKVKKAYLVENDES